MGGYRDCYDGLSPPASALFTSPLRSEANGSWVFHSGCSRASAFTRSSANRTWKYIGCSAQSVPSLSKVATRSASGTKWGEPCLVTRSTNATMACLVAVLFQEGSRSVPAVCADRGALPLTPENEAFGSMIGPLTSPVKMARHDRDSRQGEREC